MPVSTINIEYINHDVTGFSSDLPVAVGTTIGELFTAKMPSKDPRAYLILVNREARPASYVLQSGDRVSFTPTKVQGAARAA